MGKDASGELMEYSISRENRSARAAFVSPTNRKERRGKYKITLERVELA